MQYQATSALIEHAARVSALRIETLAAVGEGACLCKSVHVPMHGHGTLREHESPTKTLLNSYHNYLELYDRSPARNVSSTLTGRCGFPAQHPLRRARHPSTAPKHEQRQVIFLSDPHKLKNVQLQCQKDCV